MIDIIFCIINENKIRNRINNITIIIIILAVSLLKAFREICFVLIKLRPLNEIFIILVVNNIVNIEVYAFFITAPKSTDPYLKHSVA